MIIGVPKETASGETRVAMIPEIAGRWIKGGAEVVVQLDFHSSPSSPLPAAGDMAQAVSTAFRDEFATSFFEGALTLHNRNASTIS